MPAIEKLNQETMEFLNSIERISEGISMLAASSEEISAQSEVVDEVVNQMSDKMNQVVET